MSIIYQSAPQQQINAGNYQGTTLVTDLTKQGDFGLGTLDCLQGELILCNGVIYSANSDGVISTIDNNATTPFATVTYFTEKKSIHTNKNLSFEDMKLKLSQHMPKANKPYAIHCQGKFSEILVRALLPQASGEFNSAIQPKFTHKDISGDLIGFYFPDYIGEINMPGFHLHFIDIDKQLGGHVLDFFADSLEMKLQSITELVVNIPN